jgi:predicted tellurium resistance membrane protein TerC
VSLFAASCCLWPWLLRLRLQVLTFGIITAAVLRAVMILLGTELIQKFEPLLIGFAFILLYSAYGLLFNEEDDNDDLSDNAIVKFCRKVGSCTELGFNAGGGFVCCLLIVVLCAAV